MYRFVSAIFVLLAGCAAPPPGPEPFVRELSLQRGAGGVTVRMLCARNWDVSATYRLYVDLDGDGAAEHRIVTRHHDGRWITVGGPQGTRAADPGRGADAVAWRLPGAALPPASAARVWVEADTPQGLFRHPAEGGVGANGGDAAGR